MLGEIANEAGAIDLPKKRRRLAQRHRARTESLYHQTKARQFFGTGDEPLDVGFVELDDLWNEQNLPRYARFLDRRLELLVDDALVRGVLVDDDQAVAGLRHDIGLVHLGARRAERPVDQFGGGLRLDAKIGRRRADIEGGLRGFGKTTAAARWH